MALETGEMVKGAFAQTKVRLALLALSLRAAHDPTTQGHMLLSCFNQCHSPLAPSSMMGDLSLVSHTSQKLGLFLMACLAKEGPLEL